MFAFVKKGLKGLKRGVKGRPAPARQSARLGLESLEQREVLSGFGVTNVFATQAVTAIHSPATQGQTANHSLGDNLNVPYANYTRYVNNEVSAFYTQLQNYEKYLRTIIYDLTHSVPSFAGDRFTMTSSTKPDKTFSLTIQSQTDHLFDTASFTGTWNGKQPVTGTISGNLDGSFAIKFTFTGGSGKFHTFTGTLYHKGAEALYFIDGDMTVDGGGGPGHLSGSQTLVAKA